MDIKININYQNLENKNWIDSTNRSEHILNKMINRGIGIELIKEAIIKGSKMLRPDKSIISEYRWFKVIYREFEINNLKKVYPITVMEA